MYTLISLLHIPHAETVVPGANQFVKVLYNNYSYIAIHIFEVTAIASYIYSLSLIKNG